jgi:acyl dehydratase
VPIKEWKLGDDTGRRYGMLNADLNPIHLHPLTSNLFGFKRPIAHALLLVARAEASLREAGVCELAGVACWAMTQLPASTQLLLD